jgi:hypothetical protein
MAGHFDPGRLYRDAGGQRGPLPRGATKESWSWSIGLRDHETLGAEFSASALEPDTWEVGLTVSLPPYPWNEQAFRELFDRWGAALEWVGDLLYRHLEPVLVSVDPVLQDDMTDFLREVDRRRLGVGWRTWYGPAYVETYGLDWLLGLPDWTRPLPGGGVLHGLSVPLWSVAAGERIGYASLWPYLERSRVRQAWPDDFWPTEAPLSPAAEAAHLLAFRRAVDRFFLPKVEQGGRTTLGLTTPWHLMTEPEMGTLAEATLDAVRAALVGAGEGEVVLEIDEFDLTNLVPTLLSGLTHLRETEPRFRLVRVETRERAWELRHRFAACTGLTEGPKPP